MTTFEKKLSLNTQVYFLLLGKCRINTMNLAPEFYFLTPSSLHSPFTSGKLLYSIHFQRDNIILQIENYKLIINWFCN